MEYSRRHRDSCSDRSRQFWHGMDWWARGPGFGTLSGYWV